MPALNVTTSPNVASLDFDVNGSLCTGKFTIDLSPTTWIGSGSMLVLGASVLIKNPLGVIIKNYPTSGYDIAQGGSPAMAESVEVSMPTEAGNYQYGTYAVTVLLTDEDGTEYTLTKSVKICHPDKNHKTRNYGSLSAKFSGICKDGKMFVEVDTPPNYNGKEVESQVNDFELLYPTESQLDPLESTISSWSVQLYEGEYKLTGTICATYDYGDYVSVSVNYKVKKSKIIKCIIDECCVFGKLAELHKGLSQKCTAVEIAELSAITLDTLRLLKTAQLAAECGEDASDYITELESLLGCQCSCNCLEGTPIIDNSPAKDFIIEGCNVTKTTVGLTDSYTIENYEYQVAVNANGGVLTVSDLSLADCTKTQTLTFNISPLYNQIKGLANSDYGSWAIILNQSLNPVDISCLDVTQEQWNAYTLLQRVQAIVNSSCEGGSCSATISTGATSKSGSDVNITWNEVSGVYEVAIYVDGNLIGTVLAGVETFTAVAYADSEDHTYTIVSKCSNGAVGNTLAGEFNHYGCPTIAVPTLTLSSVADADCPYDLTSLVNALPSGIEAEWHTANNTNSTTLVADDTAVVGGTYYVFAKDSNGCYSLGVKVTIVCSVDTECTAPQLLTVTEITDGFLVRFSSAAFAPSSYTVKRRLASDPDIDASYTTLGTPTYNSTVSRWEILDETAVDNTLYVYKAISNCTASTPYITYQFANIACPALTLTPGSTDLDYSFVPVGGDITKYEVEIWNAAGTSRISYDTHLPAFSNPTTGTLLYLTGSTTYKVRIKVYIGTYSVTCNFQSVVTEGDATYTFTNTNNLTGLDYNVFIGNNNTTPTVEMYTGPAATATVTGTDISDLPAVNANVMMVITGEVIISAVLNGVGGSISGGGTVVQWSGVNGSLVMSFLVA